MSTADRTYWCCPVCRSTRVQSQMWVDPNTLEVFDDTDRYRWCDACEEDGENGELNGLDQLPWIETREGAEGGLEPPMSALQRLEQKGAHGCTDMTCPECDA